MSPTHHPGSIIPQDIAPGDGPDAVGTAQPYTQTEVEDLLYGNDRPASERLLRLRELRDEAATRESGDWGDQDPAAILDELDRAIDELTDMLANADANADVPDGVGYPGLEPGQDTDGTGRLDALAPDDVEAREAIEGNDAGAGRDEGPSESDRRGRE